MHSLLIRGVNTTRFSLRVWDLQHQIHLNLMLMSFRVLDIHNWNLGCRWRLTKLGWCKLVLDAQLSVSTKPITCRIELRTWSMVCLLSAAIYLICSEGALLEASTKTKKDQVAAYKQKLYASNSFLYYLKLYVFLAVKEQATTSKKTAEMRMKFGLQLKLLRHPRQKNMRWFFILKFCYFLVLVLYSMSTRKWCLLFTKRGARKAPKPRTNSRHWVIASRSRRL